jgi:hypothetical protein
MLRSFVSDETHQPLGDKEVAQCEAVWRNESVKLLEWAIVPPIVLLLAGASLAWIARGFRPEHTQS